MRNLKTRWFYLDPPPRDWRPWPLLTISGVFVSDVATRCQQVRRRRGRGGGGAASELLTNLGLLWNIITWNRYLWLITGFFPLYFSVIFLSNSLRTREKLVITRGTPVNRVHLHLVGAPVCNIASDGTDSVWVTIALYRQGCLENVELCSLNCNL